MSTVPFVPDDDPSIIQSVKEYTTALGVWGWLVIACAILGEVVTITLFFVGLYHAPMPEGTGPWIWTVLSAIILALVVVPFLAFHKQRLTYVERRKKLVSETAQLQSVHAVELREVNDACDDLKRRLEDRESRSQIRNAIAELLHEGGQLTRKRMANDAEYDEWKSNVQSWIHRLVQYVNEHIGKADAIMVADRTGIQAGMYQHSYREPEHSNMISGVVRLCENLKRLLDKF